MASVNKVILVGNLGKDPDVKYTAGGDAITNISVATTDTWKDKNTAAKKESTEWHHVTFFGRLAEVAAQYLKKGSMVYVEGSIHTNKYTDRNGVEKYATQIRALTLNMLSGYGDKSHASPGQRPVNNVDERKEYGDDDIPF